MKKTIIGLVTLIVINSVVFALSPTELIKLRTEWDTKLRETTEKIANNPPEFELHYFSEIKEKDLTEDNYKNETISLEVTIPYMKQIKGGENKDLVASTLKELKTIEESKNWGKKINGFPWTYVEDIDNDSWMHKAMARHVDRYNFSISLVDGNNNVIAKKPITYMICYDKKYSGYVMISDNNSYHFYNYRSDNYDNIYEEDIICFTISLKNVDLDSLSVKVENVGNKLAILPAEEKVTRELITQGQGYYKVVGNHLFAYLFMVPSLASGEINMFVDLVGEYPDSNFFKAKTGKTSYANLYIDLSSSYSAYNFFDGYEYITNNVENDGLYNFKGGGSSYANLIFPGNSLKKYEEFEESFYLNTPEGQAIRNAERIEEERKKAEAEQIAENERRIEAEKKAAAEKKAEEERREAERIEKEKRESERIRTLIGDDGDAKIEQIRLIIKDELEKDLPSFKINLQDAIFYILASEKELSSEKKKISLYVEDIKSEEDYMQLGLAIQNAHIPIWLSISADYNTEISIPENCFTDCENLEYLSTSKISSVHENAFNNCPNLSYISFWNIEELQPNAFNDCPKLKEIKLPKKIKNKIKTSYKDFIKKKIIIFF